MNSQFVENVIDVVHQIELMNLILQPTQFPSGNYLQHSTDFPHSTKSISVEPWMRYEPNFRNASKYAFNEKKNAHALIIW